MVDFKEKRKRPCYALFSFKKIDFGTAEKFHEQSLRFSFLTKNIRCHDPRTIQLQCLYNIYHGTDTICLPNLNNKFFP